MSRRKTPKRSSKHFRARGRIALSGVGLRSLGPGGGSKRISFRESARVKRPERAKVKEKLGHNALRSRRKAMTLLGFLHEDGRRAGFLSPQVQSSTGTRHITAHAFHSFPPILIPACPSPAAAFLECSPARLRPSACHPSGLAT